MSDDIAVSVSREVAVERTGRVMQLESMFDLAPTKVARHSWDVRLPLSEQPWAIGLIVGPSGAGKSSVAKAAFGDAVVDGFDWPEHGAILDGFPPELSIKEVVRVLGHVGLNTPPAWLRPFSTLSTGEQFRATVARALSEMPALSVMDEFTSTVDRAVAQRASSTIAKSVRARSANFVAVSCHYDILEWLQPDWMYEPHIGKFTWRSVQPRPQVELDFCQVGREAWPIFAPHHYLTAEHSQSAKCFAVFSGDEIVGFVSYLHFPHAVVKNMKKLHRLVVLPDWQGLGIGRAIVTAAAHWLYERGFRTTGTTAHPAMVWSLANSPRWHLKSRPNTRAAMANTSKSASLRKRALNPRRLLTYSFEYLAPDEGVAAPDELPILVSKTLTEAQAEAAANA